MSKNLELRENTEGCSGYKESNCCGSRFIFSESDICGSCKEHAETACYDCENPCEDHETFSGEDPIIKENKNKKFEDVKDFLNQDE